MSSRNPEKDTSRPAAVELVRLHKRYDESEAVRGVSLRVESGALVTLLGPSGSGKTTTLMMIAGFVPPTSGDIRLDGESVLVVPPHRRELGMVFQSYALFPHMTVAENVAFGLKMRRRPKAETAQRVRDALEMVSLAGLEGRYPKQLSGGQQQRVSLARALVYQPKVVLMDEPLGALDRSLRQQLQGEIKNLQERLGLTIIYVTHDQVEAMTMSDHLAVFRDGLIVQSDVPSEVYGTPRDVWTAKFLGDANVFEGQVASTERPGEVSVRLATGAVVHGRAVEAHQVGEQVHVVVRPENAQLSPASEDMTETSLLAVVERTEFVGETVRVRTISPSGDVVVSLSLNRGSDFVPSSGASVQIHWRNEDGLVLPHQVGE